MIPRDILSKAMGCRRAISNQVCQEGTGKQGAIGGNLRSPGCSNPQDGQLNSHYPSSPNQHVQCNLQIGDEDNSKHA